MLRLLYGNDKRNPVRTLDLAETAPGNIRLKAGGFAPGGERNELWSGRSIRFDGEKKLGESRANSQLEITCVLKTAGSQAALFYFNRKITRFFTEAKQHNVRYAQNHKVWLEYRWSDGLNTLPTPTFGQLGHYYEVLSAGEPRWPDNLHNDFDDLGQGLIEAVTLQITGSPYPEGLKQRLATAGGTITLHAKGVLIASGASSLMRFGQNEGGIGLIQNFAITGWFTLNATWSSGTKDIFDYYSSASDRLRIQYDVGNTRFVITKIVSSTTYTANSSSFAIANGDDVHLVLVQDDTTLYLYANGAQIASITAANSLPDSGTIALGCAATGATDGVDIILDGWRIMPDDVTATQADAIYDAELPIKTDGGQVGPPPYLWTKDSDAQVDNVDDSSRDNWAVIGGVGGDVESKLEIRMIGSTLVNNLFWLGLKTQDDKVTVLTYSWRESGNEVADGTASGSGYNTETGTDISFVPTAQTILYHRLFNRYRMLARLSVTTGETVTLTPYFAFTESGPFLQGKASSYTGAGAFRLVDLGDIFIRDATELVGEDCDFTVKVRIQADSTVTANFDFAALMPAPFVKVTSTSDVDFSAVRLVVEDGQAYLYDRTAETYLNSLAHAGQRLECLPHKYNYLHLLQGDTDGNFDITDTADLVIYVTPRHLLPGGMVA